MREGQRLPRTGQDDLLLGDHPWTAERVDGHAADLLSSGALIRMRRTHRTLGRTRGGDELRGADGRPARRVDLGLPVRLDDLRRTEVGCGGRGEGRAENRAEGEVRDEDRPGVGGLDERPDEGDPLRRPAGGGDEDVETVIHRRAHYVDADLRCGSVDHEVGTRELREVARRRQDAAHLEAVQLSDHGADDRSELSGPADEGYLRGHASSLFPGVGRRSRHAEASITPAARPGCPSAAPSEDGRCRCA